MSLDSGRVPPPFKCAQIIFMKPTPDPDFQKPKLVSNIPFISKLPEKVIGTLVGRHWVNISLNKDLQSVYRIFHTTETVLLKIQSDMLESLDNSCVALRM